MAAVAPKPPTEDFAARIQAAQARLLQSVVRAGLKDDAYAHLIEAQSSVIGLFPDLVTHLEATRQPVRDDDLQRAVIQGISGHAGRAVQTASIRNALIGAGLLLVTLAGGIGVGYWFRGAVPVLVGVHAGAEKCDDRSDGSRLCWIPVWERLPVGK